MSIIDVELQRISYIGKDYLDISLKSSKASYMFKDLVDKYAVDLEKATTEDGTLDAEWQARKFECMVSDFAFFVYGDRRRANYFSTRVVNGLPGEFWDAIDKLASRIAL